VRRYQCLRLSERQPAEGKAAVGKDFRRESQSNLSFTPLGLDTENRTCWVSASSCCESGVLSLGLKTKVRGERSHN